MRVSAIYRTDDAAGIVVLLRLQLRQADTDLDVEWFPVSSNGAMAHGPPDPSA